MGHVLIQVPRHVVDSLFSFNLHTLSWFQAHYPSYLPSISPQLTQACSGFSVFIYSTYSFMVPCSLPLLSAKYFTTAYQLQDNSPLPDSTPSTQNIAYPHVLHVTLNTMSTNHGEPWEQMVVSRQAFQVSVRKVSARTDITVSSTVLASYPLIIQSS